MTHLVNNTVLSLSLRSWLKSGIVGLLLVMLLACERTAQIEPEQVDTVYLGGRVYTMSEDEPWATAFAIDEGRFTAVGTDTEIKHLAGAETKVVDLAGAFVMPGLQDAHIHTQMAAEFHHNLNIDPDQPWALIASAIQSYALENPQREWILGGNLPWLTSTIGDNELVLASKKVLDKLAPDHAVGLWDVGGHALLANSKALAIAGIGADTPDPVGGTIERDSHGEATGVLRELAANLVLESATAMTVDEYAVELGIAMAQLTALGITSINEVWTYPATLKALKKMDDEDKLNMRVVVSIAHPVEMVSPEAKQAAKDIITHRTNYDGNRVKTRYVKFVLDGSAGGQTLALIEPYQGSDFKGELRNPEDIVIAEVARLHGEGIGSVLHAVGDRAVRIALDAVDGAIAQHGSNGVRHVIAHSVFIHPEDRQRFAELGVIAEFSPYFWWPNEGQEILRDELGEDRLFWAFPVKLIHESAAPMAAGSDWPVVFDPNPFPAIEAMITRESPGGSEASFGKAHAVNTAVALRIFTMGSAYELYQEDTTGSIEVGKFADFIVLDQNLLEIPTREIHKTRVISTVLEGEIIYSGSQK